jgi:DNA-binding beta-propeller fold protein YncE
LQNHQFAKLDLVTMQLSFMAGRDGDAYTDGIGDTAHISGPTQMVISPDGKKIFFPDRNNNRIRVLNTSTNEITTLTGAGKANLFNGQTNGYKEGVACPSEMGAGITGCAYFTRPTGIAISPNGKTLYVTDSVNNRIRSVDVATGKTAFIAGSTQGYRNGIGSAARFNLPNNIVVSADGKTLYVADLQNHVIRMIDIKSKRVSTLAGVGKGGHLDGAFNRAYISFPDSLAWGPNSWTLYLSEVGSQQIRALNLRTKVITTLAGSGARGTQNGTATKSAFNNPRGMIMIAANTLLVADSNNDLIRAIKTK